MSSPWGYTQPIPANKRRAGVRCARCGSPDTTKLHRDTCNGKRPGQRWTTRYKAAFWMFFVMWVVGITLLIGLNHSVK